MSTDDRTPQQPLPEQPTAVIPDDATGPQALQAEGAVPDEPRRSRWARARGAVRRPRTHRGRVALTALGAAALLLVGGGVGLAVGAEIGHDSDRGQSSSSQDGARGDDRGDGGGRGDR